MVKKQKILVYYDFVYNWGEERGGEEGGKGEGRGLLVLKGWGLCGGAWRSGVFPLHRGGGAVLG